MRVERRQHNQTRSRCDKHEARSLLKPASRGRHRPTRRRARDPTLLPGRNSARVLLGPLMPQDQTNPAHSTRDWCHRRLSRQNNAQRASRAWRRRLRARIAASDPRRSLLPRRWRPARERNRDEAIIRRPPAGLWLCHEPSSCSWLLLGQDAVVPDRRVCRHSALAMRSASPVRVIHSSPKIARPRTPDDSNPAEVLRRGSGDLECGLPGRRVALLRAADRGTQSG